MAISNRDARPDRPQISRQGKPAAPIRPRAVALGLVCVPLLCWWSMRTEIISGGSELIEASLLMIAVFLLFVLTLVNDALRKRWPGLALTQAELLTVYVMQTTSVGLAGLGQIQFLNQALGGAYYFGKLAPHWEKFQPYIPGWWVPRQSVLDAYYNGASSFFTRENLSGWAMPIAVWTTFIMALLFAFLCINTIFRRHWVHHERLTFPLVMLPLELTRENAARALLSQRTFWCAFLLVCIFRSVTGLHRIAPNFPDIADFGSKGQLVDLEPLFTQPPWNAIGYFRLSFHPLIIGVTYFLPLDVAFSMWFFYLAVKGEVIAATALGYHDPGASAASAAVPYTGEQGAGAFLAVAVFALWGARHHLMDVARKAFAGVRDVDDSGEPLSYRTAVLGLMASFAALVLFAAAGGLPWYAAVAFFALYTLMIVACTRFRAEAGPMLGYGPGMNPHEMLVTLPGSERWTAQALTPLAYLYWFDSDYRTVAMPQQMEAMKIADVAGIPARALSRWILGASLLACVAAFVSVLGLYYHYGAIAPRGDNDWRVYNGHAPFDLLIDWIENPGRPDIPRMEGIGVGFAVAALLIRARSAFFWWPFHPAGFAMAQAGAAMQWVWFATFLGWLAKSLILRYGGMSLYRRCIPWFLGMLLGDVVVSCVWSLLGVLTQTQMYMFFPG